MEITIHSKSVVIRLENDIRYVMTFHELNQVEKAIEIIRNIQNTAAIEAATIKIA